MIKSSIKPYSVTGWLFSLSVKLGTLLNWLDMTTLIYPKGEQEIMGSRAVLGTVSSLPAMI